ncbi:Inositolphosphorylceramide synthase subunit Kei1 domain containing protein [Russula decolorans]
MKLTLKHQLRPRPFASMLGFLDLKTGVILVVLFAVLNKVAGIYGLIALLTGAGGNAAQLTLYIYSALALIGLAWGIRAVNQENPKHMLYFAHIFFADHILNTIWTVYFIVHWWLYTPHDGRRNANSPAQQALIDGYIGEHQTMSEAERTAAAERVWRAEKGQALTIIILGWLIKFYFAALLYSFAHHLRRGSYRSLPLTRLNMYGAGSGGMPLAKDSFHTLPSLDADNCGDCLDEDIDLGSTYGTPPSLPVHSIPSSPINGSSSMSSGHRSRSAGAGSTGSFTDFISAPPPRRTRRTRGSLLAGSSTRTTSSSGSAAGSSSTGPSEGEDDESSSVGTAGTSRVQT